MSFSIKSLVMLFFVICVTLYFFFRHSNHPSDSSNFANGTKSLHPMNHSVLPIFTPKKGTHLVKSKYEMPPADPRPWKQNDFKIVPSDEGIIALRNGNKVVYGFASNIDTYKCVDQNRVTWCLRFSNGQIVIADKELLNLLPESKKFDVKEKVINPPFIVGQKILSSRPAVRGGQKGK